MGALVLNSGTNRDQVRDLRGFPEKYGQRLRLRRDVPILGDMKVSIYATPELWDRMQAAEPAPNWSKVFARAAEEELARIDARKGRDDMQADMQRLRASRLVNESEQHVKGNAAGTRWARKGAEWAQLERLAGVPDGFFEDPDAWEDSAFGVSGELFRILDGDAPERSNMEDFWECVAGEKYPSLEFVQGFHEGAMDVFGAAKKSV